MKSKLFTPTLNSPQATVLDREGKTLIFVNSPTHAEIPVFDGPADKVDVGHNLSLSGSGAAATKFVEKRRFITGKRGDS